MSIQDIMKFEPQLAKLESGAEPSLYALLIGYYIQVGCTTKESVKHTEQYIAALEKEFR